MAMTLVKANKILEAAVKKAQEMGTPQNIAVVDEGGNLVAFQRMDGAMLVGINIALDKAYTAAGTGFDTDVLGELSQPGKLAYGVALADRGRVIIFAGGVPVKEGDRLIGGVGVSGGLAPDDKKVAQAGIKALEG